MAITNYSELLYRQQTETNKELFSELRSINKNVASIDKRVAVLETTAIRSDDFEQKMKKCLDSITPKSPSGFWAWMASVNWISFGKGLAWIIVALGAAFGAAYGGETVFKLIP